MKLIKTTIAEGDNRSLLDLLSDGGRQQDDEAVLHARTELVEHLLDRHGTGRVLFRNTRAAVKGFPSRELSAYPLNSPEQYRQLGTRIVELHPITLAQNARTSGGGNITMVPSQAVTVGPKETWQAEKVSIWHAGTHDNPFGQRLTAFMISKMIEDSAVPMSLLADHPNVQFNYFRGGIGHCDVEMH